MSERTIDDRMRLRAFFEQASKTARAYRLAFVQKEMHNYQILDTNFDLLWSTTQHCYEQQDWEALISFREALQPFLDLHGFWNHSLTLNKWVDIAAEARGDAFNQARWRHDRADMFNQQGKYHDAEQLYQQSEEQYRRLHQTEWALKSRHMRAMVVRAQGRTAEALYLCQTTIDEARELNLGVWLAHPLYVQALFLRDQGSIRRAVALVEESLTLLADTEYAMMGQCHIFLGQIALHQKQFPLARQHLETALPVVQQAGGIRRVVTTQRFLGDLALAEGNSEEAAHIYEEILETYTSHHLDDKPFLAQVLFSKALLLIHMKQLPEAIQLLEGSVALYKEIGNVRRCIGTSFVLAWSYARQRAWKKACQLFLSSLKMAFAAGLLYPHRLLVLLRIQSM
jgi:tetratricopeptide (TPR) repeat protein